MVLQLGEPTPLGHRIKRVSGKSTSTKQQNRGAGDNQARNLHQKTTSPKKITYFAFYKHHLQCPQMNDKGPPSSVSPLKASLLMDLGLTKLWTR